MEKMNRFIVLEGVDGSGKTTIAKGLAQRINGLYVKTPGSEYEKLRSYIDNKAVPEAKLFFYLSSVFDESQAIKERLKKSDVICDRYLWSSLILHAAYFGEDLKQLEQIFKPMISRLLRPSFTLLLEVSEEEQLKRLGMRQDNSASDKFCLNQDLRKKARDLYDYVAERDQWTRISTDNRSVDSVLEEIDQKCLNRGCYAR